VRIETNNLRANTATERLSPHSHSKLVVSYLLGTPLSTGKETLFIVASNLEQKPGQLAKDVKVARFVQS